MSECWYEPTEEEALRVKLRATTAARDALKARADAAEAALADTQSLLHEIAQGVTHYGDCMNNAAGAGSSGLPCVRCERDEARAEVERLTRDANLLRSIASARMNEVAELRRLLERVSNVLLAAYRLLKYDEPAPNIIVEIDAALEAIRAHLAGGEK